MPLAPADGTRLGAALAMLADMPHAGLQDASRRRPFTDLIQVCAEIFPDLVGRSYDGKPALEDLRWALLHILETTGVPTAGNAVAVGEYLNSVFERQSGFNLHLCPLDQAGDLPRLTFGPCQVRRFTEEEFARAIQLPRLRRRYPSRNFDISSYCRFDWLVVREPVVFGPTLATRSSPWRTLDFRMDRDFGAIQPFARRWPEIVERAVFALLLLPWEDMVGHPEVDWRAFRIPWVYTVPGDPLDSLNVLRGTDTLTWVPDSQFDDATGELYETEKPFDLPLKDDLQGDFSKISDLRWAALERAQSSEIFNPLVMHFLVRAFVSEGVDEFLGHITAVEAALGLASDFARARDRPKVDGDNPGSTARIKQRVEAITADAGLAEAFEDLFRIRSAFVHGRPMNEIPSVARIRARVLARQVVESLIQACAGSTGFSRDAFLAAFCA
ncbi:MAG TPA: hypothetical protein VH088_00050 [Terriglobales bacterium]|jgi:hypothetical protein|nr:hypothetical protein [Terriglobales bacterium]